jgi:uroporphyrinogen III methyltransferase/synthase
MNAQAGTVYLVGAGPGDPGLLTCKGLALVRTADVLVHDQLIPRRLLDLAPGHAERVFAGKRAGHYAMPQEAINALLIDRARQGRRVVRLKGGDPFVFGRGAEEAEALFAAGVPFEVVPGVTAGVGVTAYAGLPVTHRAASSAVAFITGHDDPGSTRAGLDWTALTHFPGTLVVYMGVSRLRSICDRLVAAGMDPATPAALVEQGTTARQRTVAGTLADLADSARRHGASPPALVIIGAIVRRREPLAWFERLPLFGRRIVVTRPEGESQRAAESFEALGAEVVLAPTVTIGPVDEQGGPLDRAIDGLHDYDWLVFTSANGVRHFLDRLAHRGRDLRALGHLSLAAIGPATAEALAARGLKADLVPDEFRSEALAEALAKEARGKRVLLARADRGRTVLKDELERVAQVEQVAVYRNLDADALPDGVDQRIASGSIDWITLTSSAIAERLYGLLSPEARAAVGVGRSAKIASISPVTSDAVRRLGWPVAAEAAAYTWEGLVRAIVDWEQGKRPANHVGAL